MRLKVDQKDTTKWKHAPENWLKACCGVKKMRLRVNQTYATKWEIYDWKLIKSMLRSRNLLLWKNQKHVAESEYATKWKYRAEKGPKACRGVKTCGWDKIKSLLLNWKHAAESQSKTWRGVEMTPLKILLKACYGVRSMPLRINPKDTIEWKHAAVIWLKAGNGARAMWLRIDPKQHIRCSGNMPWNLAAWWLFCFYWITGLESESRVLSQTACNIDSDWVGLR